MNELSLAHQYAQNQQKPSWKDDPFDLKGFVTGVKPLSHQRKLEEYAQELVASYGEFIGNQYELNLEKLSSPYQQELLQLYIESIDREIESAPYGKDQSINSDYLCAMLAMLKDSTPKTRAKFAQITTRNLLDYYNDALQGVLDEACHDLHCNEMTNADYYLEQDLEHGDYSWKR